MRRPTGTAPCRHCGQPLSADDPNVSGWSSTDGRLSSISHLYFPEDCLRAMAARIAALEEQSTGGEG